MSKVEKDKEKTDEWRQRLDKLHAAYDPMPFMLADDDSAFKYLSQDGKTTVLQARPVMLGRMEYLETKADRRHIRWTWGFAIPDWGPNYAAVRTAAFDKMPESLQKIGPRFKLPNEDDFDMFRQAIASASQAQATEWISLGDPNVRWLIALFDMSFPQSRDVPDVLAHQVVAAADAVLRASNGLTLTAREEAAVGIFKRPVP